MLNNRDSFINLKLILIEIKKSLMKSIQLLLLISCTIFIACNQSLDESREADVTNQNSESNQKTIHTDDTFDNAVCEAYHHKRDSLNRIKYDLFTQKVLNPALQNPKLTPNNKRFLLALQKELQLDFKTKYQRSTLDHILYPVFDLKHTALGIFGNEYNDCKKTKNNTTECDILNLEYQLLSKTKGFFENVTVNEDKLVNYPLVFKEVMKNKTNQIYLYSDKNQSAATIDNFNYYQGNCLIYYHYSITAQNLTANEHPLFASQYPLDLIFEKAPAIDEQLKDELWECNDCTFKYEPETIFASLMGVDNLYFTYKDTFNPDKQFDFPERALMMTIDETTKVYLWLQDLDLLGCMCL